MTDVPADPTPPAEPAPTPPASTVPVWFQYAAKFITALVGVAAIAVTQGLIEGTAAKWVAVIISALTAAGVYVVPNAKPKT